MADDEARREAEAAVNRMLSYWHEGESIVWFKSAARRDIMALFMQARRMGLEEGLKLASEIARNEGNRIREASRKDSFINGYGAPATAERIAQDIDDHRHQLLVETPLSSTI